MLCVWYGMYIGARHLGTTKFATWLFTNAKPSMGPVFNNWYMHCLEMRTSHTDGIYMHCENIYQNTPTHDCLSHLMLLPWFTACHLAPPQVKLICYLAISMYAWAGGGVFVIDHWVFFLVFFFNAMVISYWIPIPVISSLVYGKISRITCIYIPTFLH